MISKAALSRFRCYCIQVIFLLISFSGLQAQTNVSGNQTGTWTLAGSPYVLTSSITIPTGQTLTIQPGVEIRSMDYRDKITVNGTLKALGTITDSIRFIGFANSTYTGSSHGGSLAFSAGSVNSVLEYVAVDRWGDDYYNNGAITISTSSVSITKCNIRNSEVTGIYIDVLAKPSVSANNFLANPNAVSANGNNLTNVLNNTNARINIRTDNVTSNSVIPRQDASSYYVLTTGGFSINTNITLEIKPGVEIRSMDYRDKITVNGTLIAKGIATDSIRFSGFANNTYSGSSHGGSLVFSANSVNSVLEYVAVDRWGDDYYNNGAITISTSSLSLTKSNIRNSEVTGIYMDVLAKPSVSTNSFISNPNSISANANNLTNVLNNVNAKVNIRTDNVTSNSVIPKQGDSSYYVLTTGGFSVNTGVTLEIKSGVEIRSMDYRDKVTVNGTLKAQGTTTDSIRFTGFVNSSYSGSSHGGSLAFSATSTNSVLEYVAVDRWGDDYYNNGAITISTSSVSITKCNIRNSEVTGVYIDGLAKPSVSANGFSSNLNSVSANGNNLTNVLNNTNAKINIRTDNVASNSVIPKQGGGSYYLLTTGGFSINTNITLEIKPGVEIRSMDYRDKITVNGTLLAKGIATDSIRFTGFANSTYTGSSHGGSLTFSANSVNSALEYVAVDRWGDDYYNNGAITISTSSVSITKSTIKNSEQTAIYNSGSDSLSEVSIFGNQTGFYNLSGKPVLTNCKIYDNISFGIINASGAVADTVDARNCYWGDTSGPYHATLNPTGTGNKVSNKVKFVPWIQQLIKVDQTINLANIADKYVEDTVRLNATASSGLPVTYSISTMPSTGVAVLSGNTITFSGDTGRVTLSVSQAGNSYYNPVTIQIVFKVTKHNQVITFNPLTAKTLGDAPFAVRATASSGLPVAFNIVSGPATISQDSIVTLTGSGTVTIQAIQTGNSRYFAAIPVQRSFTVYPKSPDLAVQNVTSSATLLAPNDSVMVSWQVSNIGRAASAINWTERIYMQSSAGANRTLIKQITYTDNNSLDTGAIISRSSLVTIPVQLNIGDSGVFVVEVVPGSTVQEVPGTQANNTSVQQTPWSIRKMLTLLLSDHRITEGAATDITATVNRTGSISNSLTLAISLRQSYRYSAPSTITIQAGQAGAAFTILATDNTTVEGTIKDTITVAASGFQSAADTLSVLDNDNATLSFINLPSQAIEGDTVVFRVVTSLAPANPLPVYLTLGNQARFPVPPSVTIPKDSFSAKVTVVLPQNTIPEVNTTIHIAAGAANHRPADTTITLLDDDLPNLELVLQTGIVSESAGLYATQATLRRTTASNLLPFTANLSASIPNTLILPPSISLAAGETQKSFTIGVVDNNIVDSLRPVVITASVFVSSCGCSAPPASAGSVSATLNVSDNDGPSLTVTVTPQTLPEGSASAGMLRVSRNTSTTDPLLVNLSSSDTSEAILPATVTIPAGQAFVNVPVATVNDGIADGNQTVFFYANASGFSQGAAWAVVTDLNKPDLLIASASVNNSSIPAKAIFTYQLSVKNAGSVTAPSGVMVRGYLSQDTIIDNSDSIISNDIITAPIPAGQTVQVMNAITAPERSGQYRLLFQVNPALTITEFVTTNNTSVPINLNIIPDYTATANVNPLYFLKGTTVPVTGLATKTNGTPAANKQVEIFIITNGLRRKLFATTDSTGHYTARFIPLANEAGHYTVGASYPNINDTTAQDAFDILGISINNGVVPQLHITLGDTLTGSLSVRNVSSKSLTNFSFVPVGLPSGAAIRFDTIAMFAGNGTATIHYSVTGSSLSPGSNFEVATFKAISTEGVIQNADIYYFCQAPNGYVEASISNINVKVSQTAGERLVEFRLTNKGIGATGNITVNLPQVSWLTSVTPKTLSSLATGDSAIVILKFIASAEVPFGYPVTGNIGIYIQNGNSITIPFTYEKVSVTTGTVKITVTDQFTYFAAGSPKVKGALVKIKNAFSEVVYAQGYTDSSGLFTAANVPEGTHRITVEKEKHLPYNGTVNVNPGDTVNPTAFIIYQAITFSWNVVPTGVQDQYTITLTSQYETNIPIPVVVIDMPRTMPALTGGQTYPFNVTLTNKGLITAQQVELNLPSTDPEYEFVTNYQPQDILAQQSIQVPVTMQRRSSSLAGGINVQNSLAQVSQFLNIASPSLSSASPSDSSGGCVDYTVVKYLYFCNIFTGLYEKTGIEFHYSGRDCSGTGGVGPSGPGGAPGSGGVPDIGPGAFYPGGGGGSRPKTTPCAINCPIDTSGNPNGGVKPPPEYKDEKKNCKECIDDVDKALKGLRIDFGKEVVVGVLGIIGGEGAKKAGEWAFAVGCAGSVGVYSFIDKTFYKDELIECMPGKFAGTYNGLNTLKDLISNCFKIAPGVIGSDPSLTYTSNNTSSSLYSEILNNLQIVSSNLQAQGQWADEYFGFSLTESEDWKTLSGYLEFYVTSLTPIDSTARASILNAMSGHAINQIDIQNFVTKWNTSLIALNAGVTQPNLMYPNIINWSLVKGYSNAIVTAKNQATVKGYQTIADLYVSTLKSLYEAINVDQNTVCASVSVQFSQQLTMTREAFEGTLKIFNGHPTDAMDSLSVNIQVTDQNGVPSNSLFEIQTTSLDSLVNITGTGVINAQATGSVKFLFIPEVGAAPQTPKVYNFGGSVRYWDPYVGAMTTFPLASVPITVNPSPNLMLHYFMQRNILGDDALTSPDIEPSIPAELAVMVENQGYGSAVNLAISSAQPKIVDNEKGLAINFELIGSNFQGQPKNLGVTNINFGTIPALQTRIGQWYFTSSLLGKFVSYQADVVHNNSFNNPELSLVKGVKLHELTRSIREYSSTGDNINDFLVNDIFDINDAPDILYFSQGMRTAKVYPATIGSFSAPVGPPSFTNTLTITASDTGWNYIKLPDPGNRLYDLVSVTRSDGQVIPLDNAWLTFVTLPVSRSPIYENKFHFVDSFRSLSPVTYTVVWKPKNLNVPKIDSITGVPAQTVFTPVQNLKVIFNKAIDPATFTYQDLTLTFQGGPNIMDSSVTITRIDSLTFEVDLSALTTGNGLYTFTAQAANVKDVYGISGSVGKQVSWSQFLTVPTVQAFQGIPESHKAAAFNTIQLLFNLPINVTTVTPQRFSITKNGVVQSGTLTIDSVRADHKLFYLSGLNTILTQTGEYVLTVDLPSIQATNNNFGIQPQAITLTLDNTGPVLLSLAKSDSGAIDPQHFPFVKMQFDEDVTDFNIAALQLTRNGQVLPLTITQLSNTDFKNWTAGNFGMLTYPEGNYTFTVKMDSLRDAAGNRGTGSQQISWTVDRSALIVSTPIITPDKGFSSTDGITSGQTFQVAFHVSDSVSQINVYQYDLSGETLLSTLPAASAGTITAPVTLITGGNTGIRIKATGVNGRTGTGERTFFADQVALTAQWLFADGQTITKQPDTIAVAFSSKLRGDTGILSAIRFEKNGMLLSTAGLSYQLINDTLYYIKGLRQMSSSSGTYQLSLQVQPFEKYSSGRKDSGSVSVTWNVQTINHAPIANAGNDIVLPAPGTVTLNGAASSDPDGDIITYRWIAPASITLSDSTSPTPTFTVPANHGLFYSFLLIVSDGSSFTTDVVNISLTPSACPGSDNYFTMAKPGDGYTYQWQVDSTGNGFVGLVGNSVHSGVNTDTLYLHTPSTSMYGYKYKCIAKKGSFTVYSTVYTLKFVLSWKGMVSTAWDNLANWSCGVLPDEHTDVIINSSIPHPTRLNSNGVCRSLTLSTGAFFTVATGYNLDVKNK